MPHRFSVHALVQTGLLVVPGARAIGGLGWVFIWLSMALPARGEIVELPMPNGVIATAEFRRGDVAKPAVLILHGFLQTRDFPTVRRLADALVESGYTVLAPTLSLDIANRSRSLACEAIHTHSMEKDVEEIWRWLDWLASAVPSPIVAIGHSAGSVHLLAQANERPHPRVIAMVLVSLTYFGDAPADREGPQHRRQAEADLAAGIAEPREYGLSFCASYPTLPAAYLSYVKWNEQRLKDGFLALEGVKVHLILGGSDPRIDWGWIDELVAGGAVLD